MAEPLAAMIRRLDVSSLRSLAGSSNMRCNRSTVAAGLGALDVGEALGGGELAPQHHGVAHCEAELQAGEAPGVEHGRNDGDLFI
jgi:hypothetical protein